MVKILALFNSVKSYVLAESCRQLLFICTGKDIFISFVNLLGAMSPSTILNCFFESIHENLLVDIIESRAVDNGN